MRVPAEIIAFSRATAKALILILAMAGAAIAAPLDDGLAAHGQQDYAAAMRAFRLAADQGNAAARNNLGFMYEKGQGLPSPNYAEAARWYRLAADQDHARAQINLGLLHLRGAGVEQSQVLAYMWLSRAASGTSDPALTSQAVKARDLLARQMTPAQIAEAQGAIAQGGAAAPRGPASPLAGRDQADVTRIQQALAALGFYRSTLDGLYGPGTEAAVKGWQQSKGLAATGYLTEPQLAQLRSEHARLLDAQRLAAASSSPKLPDAPPPPTTAGYPTAQAVTGSSIKLIKERGTFKVPALINGVLPLHFTVDSGATDVSIPADIVMTLRRAGSIADSDFVGEKTYVLADGSRVKSKTFRIKQLKVGDAVAENVLASVADVKGSPLLGQSFLSRFKKVSFDYGKGMLVLE